MTAEELGGIFARRRARRARTAARRPIGHSIVRVGLALGLAFATLAGSAGYWQVFEASRLSSLPDNPAVVAAVRQIVRGRILDRDGRVLANSARDRNGEPYRTYEDPVMSGVIGYASRRFGTAGLERTFDSQLTGYVRSDPVRDLLKKFDADPYDPQVLQLSISLAMQRAAVRGLGDDLGAVVMLDPRSGEVIALASTPTWDASPVANPETSAAAFAALLADPRNPLLNRATQGLYAPGSVFKIVTAIAGLGSDAVSTATTYEDQPAAERDGLVVTGFTIVDGHHRFTGGEALDFVGATEVSCNIWYALAGLDIGGEGLAEWAGRLGFGRAIPFDLPASISQVTNGGGSFGGGFRDEVELANAAYGQAETLVTPLQMALVAATVANDGLLMRPRLVVSATSAKSGTREIGPQELRRVLGGDDARAIRIAMEAAVESERGRLYTAGAQVPGMRVAGKSGTAELGGTGEPHSWFIGFAPAEAPRIAIAVLVERGGRGGERAAPLAGQLLRTYFDSVESPGA
ncbi:MAG: penicillin-binding protein 2 [Chloroflexi bacterium]|nr:penicillin-binding protein 2 [Chloroflexota bacterium]